MKCDNCGAICGIRDTDNPACTVDQPSAASAGSPQRPYRKVIAAIRRHVREINHWKLNCQKEMAKVHLEGLKSEIEEMERHLQ